MLQSQLFGKDLEKLFPVIEPGKSDSASLDNVFEFLIMMGRTMPHAITMLVPESFNDKNPIPNSLKAYYEYHSMIMEPWDGPASLVFTDGRYVGGTLDRNGLRPSRFVITEDDLIVMGSEVGVQKFPAEKIREKGRLRPGKILLVDTKLGIIIPDTEIKGQLSRQNPYGNWLKGNRLELEKIEIKQRIPSTFDQYETYPKVFGYTKDDLEMVMKPMAVEGKEPVGSMGVDTPPAVLSKKPQRLFSYFKQHFAQVTNPPIDPIRERLVMSLTNYIGALQSNLLEETPAMCKLIRFQSPIIINTDLGKIKNLQREEFSNVTINMVFDAHGGGKALQEALDRMCQEAKQAVDKKINYLILSDRAVDKDHAPIPSLLAVSNLHHYLISVKKRMQIGFIVETAEAREVMHFALLLGYGASVINPYMAFAVLDDLCKRGEIALDYKTAR